MENIIKISVDKQLAGSPQIVVIEPDIPFSEIPYFILLKSQDTRIVITIEYLPKHEQIEKFRISENLFVNYGTHSGRIYEVNSIRPGQKEDLINSLSNLNRQIIINKTESHFLQILNITFDIIKKAIKKSDLGYK